MGREQFPRGWLYEVAQWYPRVAVYDDVRRLNTEQYLGQASSTWSTAIFDVSITVRGASRGGDRNAHHAVEVLTTGQRARPPGGPSDTTVAIIPKTEVGQPLRPAAGPRPTNQLAFHGQERTRRGPGGPRANFNLDASGYDGIA